jgi:hypothetical protein
VNNGLPVGRDGVVLVQADHALCRDQRRQIVRSLDEPSNVRSGSNSEVGGRNREVRFTPESRLNSDIAACPKGAKPGSGCNSFNHLVSARQ